MSATKPLTLFLDLSTFINNHRAEIDNPEAYLRILATRILHRG
ncbi:hypothetical protein MtrunA17_Chr1g0148001 [Medicago truncatula]|uniref:Uncharacterized protein n=1 Tax=Medicago truncatula TaxID=3880 RepID=A0A396JKJ5_MEDTR|nr:hypothetical protein MtrunA17_Chr1g0148001 [Medicago truncatula]